MKIFKLVLLWLICTSSAMAQSTEEVTPDAVPNDWFLLDPETDKFQGLSVEKAYKTLLKDRPSKTVIVAVIDSGIDYNHEDLKDIMWINEDEIPGNGIDDDKNGYVDDIYGWNFIGGKNGNVDADTYEVTREYARLQAKYENADPKKVGKKNQAEFDYWLKIKDRFEKAKQNADKQYQFFQTLYTNMSFSNDTLKKILNVEKITPEALSKLQTDDQSVLMAKGAMELIFQNAGEEADVDAVLNQIKEGVEYFGVQSKYGYNTSYDSRTIVGDNYANLNERFYGNNDAQGPDAEHGTHVAGIIGANRKNNVGIRGIADNVRIMSVRAVPNGDERDKDVANAIIYAVDNGAQIINMSFGKDFSPQKEVVDKAVRYAEQKGVLLVHAAGNDSDSNDDIEQFPSRLYKDRKEAKTWLEIAASSWGADQNFVASFSNYGKRTVDLFSPGYEIYSTIPGNQYKNNSGTSMASPATAGVAALLMSYFPDLNAVQVKDIIRQSTRKFDGLKVIKPGTQDEEVNFSDLTSTGGMVNAYEAVKLAMTISKTVEKK